MAAFQHSKPFDGALPQWATNITSLPVRVSKYDGIASKVSDETAKVWRKIGLPAANNGRDWATDSLQGQVLTLQFPECLPKRLPHGVRFAEMFLAVDALEDAVEAGDDSQRDIANTSKRFKLLLGSYLAGLVMQSPRQAFALVLAGMRHQRSLQKFVPKRPEECKSFIEYFPTRYYSFRSPLMLPFACYLLDLKLTAVDVNIVQFLDIVTSIATILGNDVVSWPVEATEHEKHSREPDNTIVVMMREKGCGEEEAMSLCRHKLLQYEHKCSVVSKQILGDDAASADVKRLAQAYPFLVSGALAWSSNSPRYYCENKRMEVMKKVLQSPAQQLEIDQKFEEECDQIYRGCLAITRTYM